LGLSAGGSTVTPSSGVSGAMFVKFGICQRTTTGTA
jgi:hypothetical protein